MYKYQLNPEIRDPVAKVVAHYAEALLFGYNQVKKQKLITRNMILKVQERLEGNTAGFRKTPGIVLENIG